MAIPRVLLTGVNGFIGSHLLSLFLEKSCFVQAVVRSEAKAKRVMNDFRDFERSSLDFSVVPDITAPGAFDQYIKNAQPLDVIIHAASPFNYTEAKTPSDFINSSSPCRCSSRPSRNPEAVASFAPEVGRRRFLVTPGSNSNQETCDILRKEFPELDDKIPLGRPGQHALPAGSFKIDNSSSQKELGVTYQPFETTVADTARDLLEVEKTLTAKA
ncbi:uncharacterized protein Z519_01625 [Cladophialophora bantiana CBS 173.52]|uniref:NAD-dependent epimerase/dehydratase domain-containing protein n=1 Tax=Cladophialophora bantiana (strain ATCC 10958 / CBS 173.52 / CDC B-1940 / NIH 8579) TaxID=1442370 RepID=A0A0D2F7J3_CLAB1|nr:uncharacterized protein Z519_01625 [Cladophialophora bantiana CBS 173.52]KIW98041.1 hypothetical protein Z519_01625 [Cladophialophora bantiana CBS 173.52]